jgi:hypothetical protein
MGAKLVEKYGEDTEVKRMLEVHEAKPKGSKILLYFLQDWHKKHGSNEPNPSHPS